MCCHRCGLTWDVNDSDRPKCKADPTKEMPLQFIEVTGDVNELSLETDGRRYVDMDCDYDEQQLRTVALDDMLVESMKLLTNASNQAKLLHPGDIQGLIDVAEIACDFHEHTQSLSQRANFELAKIREKLK